MISRLSLSLRLCALSHSTPPLPGIGTGCSKCDCLSGIAVKKRPAPGTVRLPTENRNQTSIHKAAHGPTEPPPPPAPPLTRHVRLRAHPGPGYGHAVDRLSTTSAASPAPVACAGRSTACSASPKRSSGHLRSSSEACVPIISPCRHLFIPTYPPRINLFFLPCFLCKS